MLAKHVVDGRLQLVIVRRGDRSRAILRLECFPLRASRGGIRRRVIQRRGAIPHLIERVRVALGA
jgi:hypothetical protein